VEQVRLFEEKGLEQSAILRQQATHAGQQGLSATQGADSQEFRSGRTANGQIVLDRGHGVQQGLVMTGHPAHAESGQTKGFRQHPQGDGPGIEITGRRQGGDAFGFGKTVDFVGKDPGPVLPGQAQHGGEGFWGGEIACGIVREIDDQGPGKAAEQYPEFVHVRGESPGRVAAPGGDPAPAAFGDVGEGLVAGCDGHHLITRGQRRLHESIDGLFRPHMDEHFVGIDGLVEGGDGSAQGRITPGIGVAQAQPGQLPVRSGDEIQDVGHGQGFPVRGTQ